jgi:RNA recognition motif-containing protein
MSRRLYVGNLNYRTTADTLGYMFAEYGNVMDVVIIEGKGFGFIEMETDEDAARAREGLNGTELDGRTIRVDEARPRPDRQSGGGGRGGYRDREGGRDRDRW